MRSKIMSMSRKKQQKKKMREKEVRKKVLARREEIRHERKLMHDEIVREKQKQELANGKIPQATSGNPELAAKKDAEKARKVADKLKHNLEILRSLEEQYELEQATKTELNTKLEAEGYKTMKEKLDALHQKTLKMHGVAEQLAQAEEAYAKKLADESESNSDVQQ